MADLHYYAIGNGYGTVCALTDQGEALLKAHGADGYLPTPRAWRGPIAEWEVILAAAEDAKVSVAFN